jgi:hypothetical protein
MRREKQNNKQRRKGERREKEEVKGHKTLWFVGDEESSHGGMWWKTKETLNTKPLNPKPLSLQSYKDLEFGGKNSVL